MELKNQQNQTRVTSKSTPPTVSSQSRLSGLFQQPVVLFTLCTIMTLVIASIDWLTELGISIGLFYAVVVFIAGRLPDPRAPLIAAGVGTTLVLVGLFLSPFAGEWWKAVVNRGFSILTIWITAKWIGQQAHEKQTLESIVDGSPIGKLVVDQQGNIALVNTQIEELLGYSRDELIGRPVETVLPEPMRALFSFDKKERADSLRTKPLGTGRNVYAWNKHGEEVPIDIRMTPINTPSGKMVLASIVDMSERIKLETILAARVRQEAAIADFGQRALIERNIDALMKGLVTLITETLQVEYCMILELQPNKQTFFLRAGMGWNEGLVGHARVAVDARTQAGFTLASTGPVIVNDLRTDSRFDGPTLLHDHGVKSGISCIIPGMRERPFGVLGVHSTRSLVFSDDEVNFLQTISTILANAIQRNQAEQTIQASRKKYESLIEHLPDVVYSALSDQTATTTFISQRVKEWTGLDPSAFYDNPENWSSTIHPDDRERTLQTFRSAIANRAEFICEYRILHEDSKRIRHVKDHGMPIINEKNELIRYDGIMRDITEQKEVEQELKRLTTNLEADVEERTLEVRRSHENLRRLAAELTVTEHRERRRLATELHDYLAQLLVVSRIKLGQATTLKPSPEVVELLKSSDQMLDESLMYTRSLIAELSPQVLYQFGLPKAVRWLGEQMKKYGLTVEIHDTVESVDFDDDVAILLYQTVRELLINVAKHAEIKHATVSLSKGPGDHLNITVEDHGKGFKLNTIDNLKKFGLLSIRERLEALQGCFDLDSQPGKGTRATLIVPLHKNQSKPLIPSDIRTPVQKNHLPSSEIVRILLVDDMAMVREGLRSLLQNYTNLKVVAEAENGQEAIELARAVQLDVIVMDINMPKVNGIDATRHILNEAPHLKVIGLSINEDKEQRDLMLQAGAMEHLKKDCPAEELYQAICQACQKK
ncbi:PAS domain S-box protein [Candidatus Nitronereus thalassa]|uniref:PAS domain S-box protein n=1 Tax=Candidatus Nitronereus thalassa TaxID=3020898 RepID=A0ABU3KBD5_9BACT|nr:PAS domain S-box protein [Candidatus Nitronereus thalassa]MDT7043717.1 PAS domain S-box protein [Candidatus Nitronereus thalassa]